MDFATRAIEVGNYTDRSAVPIYASVTSGTTYQRHGDPSRDALCSNIASLENAKYTLVTASGVASVTLPMLALLKRGDRIICHKDLYIWSYFFVREDLPRLLDAEVVMVDMTDTDALEAELKKGGTSLVVTETVTNPMLDIIDLKKCCELAHKYGARIMVDNTFASPYLCRPIDYGCDIVSESATKYINGHGDTLGGAISTNDHEIYYQLQRMMGVLGPCLSPFSSFLISRGLQTLPIRMEKHCDNAERLVEYLDTKPFVKQLIYPGLERHPAMSSPAGSSSATAACSASCSTPTTTRSSMSSSPSSSSSSTGSASARRTRSSAPRPRTRRRASPPTSSASPRASSARTT